MRIGRCIVLVAILVLLAGCATKLGTADAPGMVGAASSSFALRSGQEGFYLSGWQGPGRTRGFRGAQKVFDGEDRPLEGSDFRVVYGFRVERDSESAARLQLLFPEASRVAVILNGETIAEDLSRDTPGWRSVASTHVLGEITTDYDFASRNTIEFHVSSGNGPWKRRFVLGSDYFSTECASVE